MKLKKDAKVKIGKKLNIKFSYKKWKTKKMLQKIKLDNIKWLLFYTDENNLLYNLEFGINIVNKIKLKKGQNYIVWSFSQLYDQINLELSNSGRNNFWDWAIKQKIDPSKVAVIAIDILKLFNSTKKEWKFDDDNKTISIFEYIDPTTFKWVMVKNKNIKNRILNYTSVALPKMSVFYGNDGIIRN